jgi:hypothetical protein
VNGINKAFDTDNIYYNYDKNTGYNRDDVKKIWFSYKLTNLITPLMKRRIILKKFIRENIDYNRNKGLDTLIKMIINLIYGVLSSPFLSKIVYGHS